MKFHALDLSQQEPLNRQISNIIVRKIAGKELGVGDKLPPEEDLCKTFNVSRFTVREAMARLVKDGYLSRRQNHGTVVISSAPARKRKIGLVAFLDEEYIDTFDQIQIFHPWHYGAAAAIEEKIKGGVSFTLAKIIHKGNEESFKKNINGLDGLLAVGANDKQLEMLNRSGLPFVLIGDVSGQASPDAKYDIVSDDPFSGIYKVVKHLADLGHRKILFIASNRDKFTWTRENLAGYKKALGEAKIPFNNGLVVDTKDYDIFEAYFAMKKYLQKNPPAFTALAGMAEFVCLGAVRALREKNIKVPADVSIASATYSAKFTCASYDIAKVGSAALEKLEKKIKKPASKPTRVLLPLDLVTRGSTKKI